MSFPARKSSTLLSFPQMDKISMRVFQLAQISREEYALLCDCANERADDGYSLTERGMLRLLEVRHLVYRSEEMQAWRLTDDGRRTLRLIKTLANLGNQAGPAKVFPFKR